VRETIRGGGDADMHTEMEPLIMDRRSDRRGTAPPVFTIVLQALVGLGAMVGGAQLFVDELLHFADAIGAPAIVLSLILAPLATELPEKANSFFWVRDGKDALALGNITGAMVFQSTIPIFIGMVFVDWSLDRYATLSMLIGLAGGAIAYWALRRRSEFGRLAVAGWVVLYSIFLIYVIVS
jgi:cation:H+ antiporter